MTFATIALSLLIVLSEYAGHASVIDGDTIEIAGQRIRLHGIDAPESAQHCLDADLRIFRCGQDAANALDHMINDRLVRCEQLGRDRYNRIIARCFLGELDLNEAMVRSGHALAYRRYSSDYVGAEAEARSSGAGMWRGDFVSPWDWRRGERLTPSRLRATAPEEDRDCSDFTSWEEAQAFFEQSGPGDPHGLDRDGNGIACQSLRS